MARPGASLCRPRPQPLWCSHRYQQSLGGPGSGGPRLTLLEHTGFVEGQVSGLVPGLLPIVREPQALLGGSAHQCCRQAAPGSLLSSAFPAQSGFGFLWATGLGSLCHLPPQPKCGPGTLVPQRVFAWRQGAPAVRVVSLGCQCPWPRQSPTHVSAPSPWKQSLPGVHRPRAWLFGAVWRGGRLSSHCHSFSIRWLGCGLSVWIPLRQPRHLGGRQTQPSFTFSRYFPR